mmetsp:Transcript_21285/g.45265  ORF Transcript_21285/g.45265 Transcript_21285/m.45265 type:complete len:279 (-) Transcript_21285:2150-2986(-)
MARQLLARLTGESARRRLWPVMRPGNCAVLLSPSAGVAQRLHPGDIDGGDIIGSARLRRDGERPRCMAAGAATPSTIAGLQGATCTGVAHMDGRADKGTWVRSWARISSASPAFSSRRLRLRSRSSCTACNARRKPSCAAVVSEAAESAGDSKPMKSVGAGDGPAWGTIGSVSFLCDNVWLTLLTRLRRLSLRSFGMAGRGFSLEGCNACGPSTGCVCPWPPSRRCSPDARPNSLFSVFGVCEVALIGTVVAGEAEVPAPKHALIVSASSLLMAWQGL